MSAAVSTDEPQNFVGGEWRGPLSGDSYQRVTPVDGTTVLGEFAASNDDDVDAAVWCASEAAAAWAAAAPAKRAAVLTRCAAILRRRSGELAQRMSLEMGKPLRESEPEVHRAAAVLDYYASEAQRPTGETFAQAGGGLVRTMHRPRGVIGLVTPWNFPVAIPTWKIAPALVYGNAVVLKPSEDSPWTTRGLIECFAEAGIPPGVLGTVNGGASVGAGLVSHPLVAALSFTGSAAVGNAVRVAGSSNAKPVQLELGGQNAVIVNRDADLTRAAEAVFAGAYFAGGQKCTSSRRIFVHGEIFNRFRDALTDRMGRGRVGDPLDVATEVGPLVNARQIEHVEAGLRRGLQEGASVVSRMSAPDRGYYLGPVLLADVSDTAFLAQQEVFGPIASLFAFDNVDEAIGRANGVEQGLSMAMFSNNLADVEHFINTAQAGVLHVNSATTGTEVHVPFGGIKASGWGPHEQGRAARDFYTEVITVYQDA